MKRLLAAFFIGSVLLSCSKKGGDDPEQDTKKELIGIHLLNDNGLPITIDPRYWAKDHQNKVIKYGVGSYPPSGSVEYSDNRIIVSESSNTSNETIVRKNVITLENNRVQKLDYSIKYEKDGTDYASPVTYHYSYNAEGYLTRIMRESNNALAEFIAITIENGNAVKLVNRDITYKYTYDTKEYTPMSDWAPLTPIASASNGYYFILFDDILGKKNKNNIVRVDVEYKPDHILSYDFITLTYEPEFDGDDNILAIKHTGSMADHFSTGGKIINFSNVKSEFIYRTVEK